MKIVWCANHHYQPTGYGTIARHLIPYIHHNSRHEVAEFAISGISRLQPHEWEGVKVYGATPFGGHMGYADWGTVQGIEKPQVWVMNWDLWATGDLIPKTKIPYVAYVPIDHDPLAPAWEPSLKGALEVIPYCQYGAEVMRKGLGLAYPVVDPIPHGVDTGVFRPLAVSKSEAFGVETPQDAFTVGIFKNNQGTRAKYEVQLEGWKMFLDEVQDDRARLYIHAMTIGPTSFNIEQLVKLFGVSGTVYLIHPNLYRYGLSDQKLAEMYNACDVVLNCVAGEGWGLPITEAFACGKPVIATACTSMPELLTAGESSEERTIRKIKPEYIPAQHGWLVPTSGTEWTVGKVTARRVFRPEDVAAALIAAYEKPEIRKERGEAAHKWVQALDWRHVGDTWIRYLDALEERITPKKYTWSPVLNEGVGGNKIAGVVFSFNRPAYLIRSLDALTRCEGADNCDWYIYQDGWRNDPEHPYATREEEENSRKFVEQCAEVASGAPFKHKEVVMQETNLCIGRQVRQAWSLFERYDKVLFFDDDHVVSSDYIKLLLAMNAQYPEAIVGAQATEPHNIPPRAGLQHVGVTVQQSGEQRPGRWRWIGYLMPKAVFAQLAPRMEEYWELIEKYGYRDLPHHEIRAVWGVQVSGWDGIADKLCDELGIQRIATVIPRGRYIGEFGLFGTPALYKASGWGQRLHYEFEEYPVRTFEEWSA